MDDHVGLHMKFMLLVQGVPIELRQTLNSQRSLYTKVKGTKLAREEEMSMVIKLPALNFQFTSIQLVQHSIFKIFKFSRTPSCNPCGPSARPFFKCRLNKSVELRYLCAFVTGERPPPSPTSLEFRERLCIGSPPHFKLLKMEKKARRRLIAKSRTDQSAESAARTSSTDCRRWLTLIRADRCVWCIRGSPM